MLMTIMLQLIIASCNNDNHSISVASALCLHSLKPPWEEEKQTNKNKWLKNSSTSYREENIIWHSIWKPLASLPLFGRYTESNNVIISNKTLKISILHDKVQHQDIRRDVQWEPKNKKTCHQYTCLWLVCWDQFPHQSKLKGNTIYSHMSIKLFCFT